MAYITVFSDTNDQHEGFGDISWCDLVFSVKIFHTRSLRNVVGSPSHYESLFILPSHRETHVSHLHEESRVRDISFTLSVPHTDGRSKCHINHFERAVDSGFCKESDHITGPLLLTPLPHLAHYSRPPQNTSP